MSLRTLLIYILDTEGHRDVGLDEYLTRILPYHEQSIQLLTSSQPLFVSIRIGLVRTS